MPHILKALVTVSALALAQPALAQATNETDAPSADTGTPAEPEQTPAPEATPAPESPAPEPQAEPEAAPAADGNQPAPGELSMGAAPDSEPVGEAYTAETFDDWQMRCVRTETGQDPCQLYQLLKDADGNSVAEFSLFGLPPGQQAAAGATIITPLETLLTEQLTLQIDSGQAKRYPFSFCSTIGCFARVGFTGDEITQFKRGSKATLTIVPAAAPDQKVELPVSLKGFTAGYDAVNAHNAAN